MKSDLSHVAGQYADAVMQIAADAGNDKAVLDNLKFVNQVVNNTPDFGSVLRHPGVPTSEKKQLIISAFTGKVNELTLRLLELLADRRRLDILPHIEREYEKLWRAKQNILTGTLYYAERPDESVLSEIKARLEAKLGKSLELSEQEDKSLIGGYVLKIGDQIIDGSLKGRLQVIEKQLLSV